jgi:hypothetical protein
LKPPTPHYPDQFTLPPDLLHVAIPRHEIIAAMDARGEDDALGDVCLAVAVIADAIGLARLRTEA